MPLNKIPIEGVNLRLTDDQVPSGATEELTNLRPNGSSEDPYWVPDKSGKRIENGSGSPFSHPKESSIIGAFWYFYRPEDSGTPSTSYKERLLLAFSDGTLEIINPKDSWSTESSKNFGTTGPQWGVDFAVVGDVTAIAVSKNNVPFQIFMLYKGEIIPFQFPTLPILSMSQDNQPYMQEDIDAGDFTGLEAGFYAYRYGFRLPDGNNLMLSPPVPFEVAPSDSTDRSELVFKLDGYTQSYKPDNFPFWNKILSGIDVYLTTMHDSKRDVLLNGKYYNAVSFGSIDTIEGSAGNSPNVKRYKRKSEEIQNADLFEVDGGSFHGLASSCVSSYNSRLILGRVSVDFVEPPVGIYGFSITGIAMSPIEHRSEQQPVQGDPYESYSVYYQEFTLTFNGSGVLPEGAVTITNTHPQGEGITNSYALQGGSDKEVKVGIISSAEGGHRTGFWYEVNAQAYETMSMNTAVGDPFTYTSGEY